MRLKERKCDKAYSSCVLLAQFFEPSKITNIPIRFPRVFDAVPRQVRWSISIHRSGVHSLLTHARLSWRMVAAVTMRARPNRRARPSQTSDRTSVIASGCSARGCVCGTVVFCFSATFARCSHTIHAPNDNAVSETSTPVTWNVRRHSDARRDTTLR